VTIALIAAGLVVLAVFGMAIVVGMLLSWVMVTFGAWWLIASSADGAVRVAQSGQPASLLAATELWGRRRGELER
jgi:hypothetical protein